MPDACCFADGGAVATGGKEAFLRLWDLETGKSTFTAKNVPFTPRRSLSLWNTGGRLEVKPDFLQLRRPVWVRDIRFFPEAPQLIATATGHHQVGLSPENGPWGLGRQRTP